MSNLENAQEALVRIDDPHSPMTSPLEDTIAFALVSIAESLSELVAFKKRFR